MTQAEVLAILKSGANVFLTGEPGSGKTHTINQYVAHLRSFGIEPAITASTGIAATHIGGFTIHSWSGIGIRRDLTAYDLDHIAQNKNTVRRITDVRTLIIDEVSMLSARTLSMVDAVCREIRHSEHAFGGLQVILVGDFFQLPPVSKRDDANDQAMLAEHGPAREQFAFDSPAWTALNPLVCYLSEQHRQEDAAFLALLAALRRGSIAPEHRQLLRSRYARESKDGITQLYSHNADVDHINHRELAKLPGKATAFTMDGIGPEKLVVSLKRGCLSPETLSIKIGARVMFTRNDATSHRYVNGTLGTISGFSSDGGYPIVKTHAGKTIVAEPEEWHIEDGGRILARITQVPLRLAWAMTVHKSQGMSLDAAHMNLSDTFEYGQGYVALSRVRTLAGLSLAGLNERALEVHPKVLEEDAAFREQSDQARERFGAIPVQELQTLHANFIRACGGTPEAGGRAHTSGAKKSRASTLHATLALLQKGKSIAQIAQERGLALETIVTHLEQLVTKGVFDPDRDAAHLERPRRFKEMKEALETVYRKEQAMLLAPARALLDESYSYDELRLARLFLKPSA